MYKTTPEDFELFKSEVLRLIQLFQIDDWAVYFEKVKSANYQAACVTNVVDRTVTFRLADKIDSPEQIKISAFHEVCHLLIVEIGDLARYRFVTEDEVTRATESTVRKLQSILKPLI
jgi:hypothetical protein